MLDKPLALNRRLPIGAEVLDEGRVHFRVWAPRCRQVEVVLYRDRETSECLLPSGDGYFEGVVALARTGDLYRFRLDDGGKYPDPASRFQPEGPHGPSQIVDATQFQWNNSNWCGVKLRGQVIYETHIGTLTPEGTWLAAIEKLPELAEIGITVLEVMPVADFPGQFGWGYDGVNLFAPTRLYGTPDDFRRFIDAAHGLNLAVILDVVYNHIGPDGNYLGNYSQHYFSTVHPGDWGDAINFDDGYAGPVRDFYTTNAAYWIEEFCLDGLRLDATQQIFDGSAKHIIADINESARQAAGGRDIILIAENERQEARLVRPLAKGGLGLDAIWNDDFHHTARVALTKRNEAYYVDYGGTPQELLSSVKWGFLFQGQRYQWQKARRGHAALDLLPEQFVTFLENHDQLANSASGERPGQLSSPSQYRALTALMLLSPGTPMLFQGQEFGSTTPFLYFADHHGELAKDVAQGRIKFLSQFPSLALPEVQATLQDPASRATFERCKLDWGERERNATFLKLHTDLCRLRKEEAVFSAQRPRGCDGAVLSHAAFVLRFFDENTGADRLLIINLDRTLHLNPAPEPLLAPPEGMRWEILWSSEDILYGGGGTPALDTEENWTLPGESAVVLRPVKPKEGAT